MESDFTLITGATGEIGNAIARRLSQNRPLILMGGSIEGLESTRSAYLNSSRHLILPLAVSELKTLGAGLADFLGAKGAKVAEFVHAAGMSLPIPADSSDAEALKEMFSANLFSAIEILRVLADSTVNADSLKNAVFISSAAPHTPTSGGAFYASSKAALDAYMHFASAEFAPRLRLNSVSVGKIRTKFSSILGGEEKSAPLGAGRADDVSGAVAFLLSDDSRWITGQTVTVDGGGRVL